MDHKDCIFCQIINGDIPSAKVYEDEHVYAFLDISQVTKGHTLVIPKTHTRNIYDTPGDVAKELFERIPQLARAIKMTYQPDGMNILNNNEKAASQTVFHLHFHLIPRYLESDNSFNFTWENNTDHYTLEDLQNIANDIHLNIDNDNLHIS